MTISKAKKSLIFRNTILAIIVFVISLICVWFWLSHSKAISSIANDSFSVPLVITLLVFLYLLLIAARSAHESQYALWLIGRAQELFFLGQWQITVAPLVALLSLAVGYFKEPWLIPTTVIGFAAAIFAIYSVVAEITGAWLRPVERERYFFLELKSPPNGDSHLTDKKISVPEGFHSIEPRWNGRSLCVSKVQDWQIFNGFLTNQRINQQLQDSGSKLSEKKILVLKPQYKLPQALEDYRETALIHVRAKGGLLHNESKIRLCSDLEKLMDQDGNDPLIIQKTSYYASVCSNELTKYEIIAREATLKTGLDMFNFVRRASTGVVIGFDDSDLSNHIGGATLAITPDGDVILNKQGRLNVISPGLIVPSGSGSFDWNDHKNKVCDLHGLIKFGLERELMEECGITAADIEKTIVLGQGRDLSRGGKPEFFGVTLLKRQSIRTHTKIANSEIGFVDLHDNLALKFKTKDELTQCVRIWLNNNQGRYSTTLAVNLNLLVEANPDIHNEIASYLQ